jgi:hypothetical protein
VLHRDLKPENLYVCPLPDGSELLKILDFGIARCLLDTRLTGTGEIFGTPQYMAPERITSTEAGIPADLYALGCIMFRCVTGRLPFAAKDVTSFLIQHLREQPPSPRSINPAVPPDLEALILQCLEKDPALRPVDAHAIERALTALGTRHPRPRRASGGFVAPTPPARTMPPASSGSLHGMFATDSASRWGRRSEILSKMLLRAFPAGTTPELSAAFGRLRATVTMMSDVHARWLQEQQRLDALAGAAKEAQGRFGRAMDALAQDLSQSRQRTQAALAQATAAEAALKARGEPFRAAHCAVVALGPNASPTVEVADRYRAAMTALEALLPHAEELHRAQESGRQGDAEVKDLEYQIDALRSAAGAGVAGERGRERGGAAEDRAPRRAARGDGGRAGGRRERPHHGDARATGARRALPRAGERRGVGQSRRPTSPEPEPSLMGRSMVGRSTRPASVPQVDDEV